MVIAAHLDFSPTLEMNIEAVLLSELVKQYPTHQFVFFYTGNPPSSFIKNNRACSIQVATKAQPIYIYHIWSWFSLPRLLKKYKVDIFVNCNLLFNKYIHIPQVLFYSKQFIPQNKKRATKIPDFKNLAIAFTEKYFIASSNWAVPEEKLYETGYPIAEGFAAASWQEKLSIKTEFTAGQDFFISIINPQNKNQAIKVLKAFSIFKKRQKSAIELILVLKGMLIEEAVPEFHLYKYRQEVSVQPWIGEAQTNRLLAAAFAHIAVSNFIEVTDALISLSCKVPVIVLDSERFQNLFKQAAIYCQNEEKSIADGMMEIYKNELLQQTLIENSQEITIFHTLASSCSKLWDAIIKIKHS